MEDYKSLERQVKDFKEEVRQLNDVISKQKIEITHAKKKDESINYLKESNLKANSRISELEMTVHKA